MALTALGRLFALWRVYRLGIALRRNHGAVLEAYARVEEAKADARRIIGERARSSAVYAQRKWRLERELNDR